jgi:hypothetical protein
MAFSITTPLAIVSPPATTAGLIVGFVTSWK